MVFKGFRAYLAFRALGLVRLLRIALLGGSWALVTTYNLAD